jgi:hypothetical protein
MFVRNFSALVLAHVAVHAKWRRGSNTFSQTTLVPFHDAAVSSIISRTLMEWKKMKMIMLVAVAGAAPAIRIVGAVDVDDGCRALSCAQAAPFARALETGFLRKCLDSDLALGATSEAAYYSGGWSAPASR